MNIGRFCLGLEKVDQIFIRKELLVKEGMRNIGYSKFQTDYSICHPVEEEMLKYKVEQKFRGFEVVRTGPDGAEIARYRMMRNRFECNKQLCLVRCSNCPPESLCAHDYTCECPKYAYRNFCKHSHVLAMLSNAFLPKSTCHSEDQSQLDESNRGVERTDGFSNLVDRHHVKPVDQEFVAIQKRFKHIEEAYSSSDIRDDEKLTIVGSLLHGPINDVQIPSRFSNNPTNFPKLDRKRTHSPKNRSLFPSKKRP